MNEKDIEQARRWVRLKGWRWVPGMAVLGEILGKCSGIRICEVLLLSEEDAAYARVLERMIDDGTLSVVNGYGMKCSVRFEGIVGGVRRIVGTEHPSQKSTQDDRLFAKYPRMLGFEQNIESRFFPDLHDEATRWCLVGIASDILEDKGISTEGLDCATLLNLLEECEQAEAGRADESPWYEG